jgi:hypothetical protein
MAIAGLLLGGFLQFYSVMEREKRYEVTKQRLRDVRTALTHYVIMHGHLPCPAAPSGAYAEDQCSRGTEPVAGVERYKDIM